MYVLHIRDDYVESQILLQERGTFLKIPKDTFERYELD